MKTRITLSIMKLQAGGGSQVKPAVKASQAEEIFALILSLLHAAPSLYHFAHIKPDYVSACMLRKPSD